MATQKTITRTTPTSPPAIGFPGLALLAAGSGISTLPNAHTISDKLISLGLILLPLALHFLHDLASAKALNAKAFLSAADDTLNGNDGSLLQTVETEITQLDASSEIPSSTPKDPIEVKRR